MSAAIVVPFRFHTVRHLATRDTLAYEETLRIERCDQTIGGHAPHEWWSWANVDPEDHPLLRWCEGDGRKIAVQTTFDRRRRK